MKHVVIIGNGISGITAARHIRKRSDHKITVISAETDHFFSRTALMYIYMGHMKFEHTKPYEDWFWIKNKIDLLKDFVRNINFESRELILAETGSLKYDELILALGSKPNMFGWPGQDLKGVQGLYSYQDLVKMEEYTQGIQHAVVVGGGLIGVEMVEMLSSRNIPTTFLVREKSFWDVVLPREESALINRHILAHHIDLRLSTELKEIISDDNGRAEAIITSNGDLIPCQFVGLTAGVSPNIEFLKNSSLETNRGILVNRHLETNHQGVYAIGDCAEFREPFQNRRPIEQVWYTGRMQGEVVAATICDQKTEYKPGIWFNSAKFFDVEYQTYGHVWGELKENESQFYWEHDEGDKCIKFVYDKSDRTLLGINTFGIRLRHEICDQWLKDGKAIEYVIEHLEVANFDPEFFRRHEKDIVNLFNETHPKLAVSFKPKSLFSKIFG